MVRRDVFGGKVWTAAPHRVITDDGSTLLVSCWPGVVQMAPTSWIGWVRHGDPAVRQQGLHNLAGGHWELDRFTWRDTTLLVRYTAGDYFSVSRFFDRHDRCGHWYVDFVRPPRRTTLGIDTFDLVLDLVVSDDLSRHRWKDDDEYAQGRRLGLIDDTTHAQVDLARQQVLGLVETRQGPFAGDWSSWRRDPDWPPPVLPDSMALGVRARSDPPGSETRVPRH